MNKFLEWIDGFRLKQYDVQLATNLNEINKSVIDSIFESITDNIAISICESYIIAISDFDAIKLHGNLNLYQKINENRKPISHLKVSHNNLETDIERELCVLSTVFCLGLDNNIWKFKIKINTVYKHFNNDMDIHMIDALIEYSNLFIKYLKLSAMCKHDVYIEKLSYYNSTNTDEFNGWVKSFCRDEYYTQYGIDNEFSDMSNDANLLLDNVDEEEIQEELNESMIVDVIRRKN